MSAPVRFRQLPTISTIAVRPTGNKPTISARTVISQQRQHMTAEQAKDPEQVARNINALQQQTAQSTRSLRNNPETGAIIFQGVAVLVGGTKVFTHNFGRPFQGYRVTRTYAGAGSAILLQDAALPAGLSVNNSVALTASNSGTIDVWIW
jgi:hypothetical protein